MCNVLEWQDKKIIYRKYASLYFVAGVSGYENELSILEALHHFVESLDKYFGSVCELDLIYNFHKVGAQPALSFTEILPLWRERRLS